MGKKQQKKQDTCIWWCQKKKRKRKPFIRCQVGCDMGTQLYQSSFLQENIPVSYMKKIQTYIVWSSSSTLCLNLSESVDLTSCLCSYVLNVLWPKHKRTTGFLVSTITSLFTHQRPERKDMERKRERKCIVIVVFCCCSITRHPYKWTKCSTVINLWHNLQVAKTSEEYVTLKCDASVHTYSSVQRSVENRGCICVWH